MNRRIWMMLVAIILVVSIVPMAAMATECTCDTPHVHDASCGYVEERACDICNAKAYCPNCASHAIFGGECNGQAGSPCTHVCHTHVWSEPKEKIIKEATCTASGIYTYVEVCECGAEQSVLPQMSIDPLEHDMADATCTAPATCKYGCGYTEGEPLEHDMADATCEEPATCKYGCGYTEGEALGHDYGEEQIKKIIKPATCMETGIYTYVQVCGTCGADKAVLPQMALDKVDHDWDEGEVTVKPTYDTKGEIVYTCKFGCGTTMTEELDTLQAPAAPGTAGLDYVPKTGSFFLEWLYNLIF